ncbi:MAG: hypothetical protein KIT31_31585 [Deltaproteobacteria bacterium]|nr:hypothetical protein [Deltaproteobacteria bacterium]
MRLLVLCGMIATGCSTASGDTPPQASAPAAASAKAFSQADYTAHIAALRKRLDEKQLGHLAIRIEEPFVVVGEPARLDRDRTTVRWAADHLEKAFFAARPTRILDVYLFGDAASYEAGVKALTGDAPTTPYGFYASSENGLFMNIATGGGTLVHEIVHPYVEADFPNAPPWLNEGLGSLFEQSNERGGWIIGMTNWRLGGLQKAIKRGGLQSFHTLTHLTSAQFYGDDSGVNYAQARYLMYYLQEKGVLRDFYRTFRANRAKDPSGYTTLVGILGEKDMADFQRRWESYVAKLTFR